MPGKKKASDQEEEQSGPGRPKATHGLKRRSMMVDPDQLRRLRLVAVRDNRHMYELLAEALEKFLGEHEIS